MHDLRRQALESGKTVSRKAKAKSQQSSPASSRPNSAPPSRSASRNTSRGTSDEEEEGNLSDETSFSVNSIDEIIVPDGPEQPSSVWASELADRVEEILDRKRSSVQGRETTLAAYVRVLTAQYAAEEIVGKEGELVAAFLKSIKAESSEKETTLAIKALAMTIITSPSDLIFDAASAPLKRTISDSSSIPTKAAAIHALGTCTFFGGASEDDILENMTYLLEIISSDGHYIDAPDEAEPVTAAIQEWGFLSTLVTDLSQDSEEPVSVFADQLSSSDPSVQIAAGETIALLYEKSYSPLSEEDSQADYSSFDIISDPEEKHGVPSLIQRYTAYRRTDQLTQSLSALASLSTHRLSKKDQKALRTTFADILNSIENPTHGPRYQTALNAETGQTYGSRMVVRIHGDGVMRIDKWWKLHRLQGLRRVLQGGFVTHYERNEVVFQSLPIMITNGRKKAERDSQGF